MPLFRLLILSLLVALLLGLVRGVRKRLAHKPANPNPDASTDTNQDIVACHRCGLHIPKSEAIIKDKHHYCCREHSE